MSIKLFEFNRHGYDWQEFYTVFADSPWWITFEKWRDPFPECHKFWLGGAYYNVPDSWFLKISREELWNLLNDKEVGLPRYSANLNNPRFRKRPGRGVDSRVCALIQGALTHQQGRTIVLVYEPSDRSQAEMITRCIEWLTSFIEQPYK
jgi:hypothetical protein